MVLGTEQKTSIEIFWDRPKKVSLEEVFVLFPKAEKRSRK